MPATKKAKARASMRMSSMGVFLCDVNHEPKDGDRVCLG